MKRSLFIISLILVIFSVLGLKNYRIKDDDMVFYESHIVKKICVQNCNFSKKSYNKYSLITVPIEEDLGDFILNGEHLYYFTHKAIAMSNDLESSSLVRYTFANNKTEKILSINKDRPFYINELVSTRDNLVCQVLYHNDKREFVKLDIAKNCLTSLYSPSHINIAPSFSLDAYDNYLTWYEGKAVNDKEVWDYKIYSLSTDSIKTIKNVSVSSPYMNPNIRNGNIVYLFKEKEKFKVLKYNLRNDQTMTIYMPKEIKNIQNICANDHYIAWHDKFHDCNIHVYDIKKKKLNKLSIKPFLFSMDLVNNHLIVNDDKDLGLLAVNLKNYEIKRVGDKDLNEGSFVMGEVCDNKYISLYTKYDENEIPVMQGFFVTEFK